MRKGHCIIMEFKFSASVKTLSVGGLARWMSQSRNPSHPAAVQSLVLASARKKGTVVLGFFLVPQT